MLRNHCLTVLCVITALTATTFAADTSKIPFDQLDKHTMIIVRLDVAAIEPVDIDAAAQALLGDHVEKNKLWIVQFKAILQQLKQAGLSQLHIGLGIKSGNNGFLPDFRIGLLVSMAADTNLAEFKRLLKSLPLPDPDDLDQNVKIRALSKRVFLLTPPMLPFEPGLPLSETKRFHAAFKFTGKHPMAIAMVHTKLANAFIQNSVKESAAELADLKKKLAEKKVKGKAKRPVDEEKNFEGLVDDDEWINEEEVATQERNLEMTRTLLKIKRAVISGQLGAKPLVSISGTFDSEESAKKIQAMMKRQRDELLKSLKRGKKDSPFSGPAQRKSEITSSQIYLMQRKANVLFKILDTKLLAQIVQDEFKAQAERRRIIEKLDDEGDFEKPRIE